MIPLKEAAKRLGVSRSKLYQKVSRREIAHYRIDGKILFTEEQIQAFLDGCLVEQKKREMESDIPQRVPTSSPVSGFTFLPPKSRTESAR